MGFLLVFCFFLSQVYGPFIPYVDPGYECFTDIFPSHHSCCRLSQGGTYVTGTIGEPAELPIGVARAVGNTQKGCHVGLSRTGLISHGALDSARGGADVRPEVANREMTGNGC